MPPLERVMARLTGGRVTMSGLLVPSLVLHTTGAKSGEPRRTELMYVPDGRDYLVTGSNFAREHHPAWTSNLLKNPDAVITVRGRDMPVHATLLSDDQREQAWATIQRQWPNYRQYERAAGRQLRIFRLRERPNR
jgi:deazaflavin-dependent oxidoreductase (nitroreductase family)